jgi:Fe-S cluster assembly protein SufB
VYNFVTKRGLCLGEKSSISWTQIETGSAITWKYPSLILKGKLSRGLFYSIALTNNYQQTDTGTKVIHIGEKTCSTIVAKSISYGNSINTFRSVIKILEQAKKSRIYSQCDSLMLSKNSISLTLPTFDNANKSTIIEHEATTGKINDEILYYCKQRCLDTENAIMLVVTGFCKNVLTKLPIEFALEAKKLLNLKLEGAIG